MYVFVQNMYFTGQVLSGWLPLLPVWLRLWPQLLTLCEARPEIPVSWEASVGVSPRLPFTPRGQKQLGGGKTCLAFSLQLFLSLWTVSCCCKIPNFLYFWTKKIPVCFKWIDVCAQTFKLWNMSIAQFAFTFKETHDGADRSHDQRPGWRSHPGVMTSFTVLPGAHAAKEPRASGAAVLTNWYRCCYRY